MEEEKLLKKWVAALLNQSNSNSNDNEDTTYPRECGIDALDLLSEGQEENEEEAECA